MSELNLLQRRFSSNLSTFYGLSYRQTLHIVLHIEEREWTGINSPEIMTRYLMVLDACFIWVSAVIIRRNALCMKSDVLLSGK